MEIQICGMQDQVPVDMLDFSSSSAGSGLEVSLNRSCLTWFTHLEKIYKAQEGEKWHPCLPLHYSSDLTSSVSTSICVIYIFRNSMILAHVVGHEV